MLILSAPLVPQFLARSQFRDGEIPVRPVKQNCSNNKATQLNEVTVMTKSEKLGPQAA